MTKQQWKWRNFAGDDTIKRGWRLLQIYGPPGSGKSTATFSWVQSVCETCQTKAYWMSCAAEGEECWFIEGGGAVARSVTVTDTAIPQTHDDLMDARIVVFDGIRKETLERWRGMMNELARNGTAVIVVSSEGVRFHEGDSGDITKLDHVVPSWTVEEYSEACTQNEFWRGCQNMFQHGTENDSVDRRIQLITDKFEVAGHSARFMFSFFEAIIKQRIKKDAKAMGGIDSLDKAVRNTASSGAVNTVVARLQGDKNGTTPAEPAEMPTIGDLEAVAQGTVDYVLLDAEIDEDNSKARLLSAFASEEVAKNIPSSIARLRSIAHALRNKVIEGYAFEEQLKKSLREAEVQFSPLALLDQDGQRVEYPVSNVIFCDADELLDTLRDILDPNTFLPNTWIFVAGQQGTFDAIHIQSLTHLRFVQATLGQTHTFFLDIIDRLLRNLVETNTWTHLDFLLIRPWGERRHPFQLKPARGSLQPYLRFDGSQWDRRDYRSNVNYQFLQWSIDTI